MVLPINITACAGCLAIQMHGFGKLRNNPVQFSGISGCVRVLFPCIFTLVCEVSTTPLSTTPFSTTPFSTTFSTTTTSSFRMEDVHPCDLDWTKGRQDVISTASSYLRNKKLLGSPGIATRSDRTLRTGLLAILLVAFLLQGSLRTELSIQRPPRLHGIMTSIGQASTAPPAGRGSDQQRRFPIEMARKDTWSDLGRPGGTSSRPAE